MTYSNADRKLVEQALKDLIQTTESGKIPEGNEEWKVFQIAQSIWSEQEDRKVKRHSFWAAVAAALGITVFVALVAATAAVWLMPLSLGREVKAEVKAEQQASRKAVTCEREGFFFVSRDSNGKIVGVAPVNYVPTTASK